MPDPGSGTGRYVRPDGYVKITRRGPHRDWLEHQVVISRLAAGFSYHELNEKGLPAGFEIHHINFDKADNRPENLLLVPEGFHAFMGSSLVWRQRDGRFLPRPEIPDWVTDDSWENER